MHQDQYTYQLLQVMAYISCPPRKATKKNIYTYIYHAHFFHLLVTSHNNNQQMYQSHFQLTKEFVFLSDDFINFFSVLASTCCYIFNKAIILCVCHFIRSFDAMKYVTFPSTLSLSLSLSLTEEIGRVIEHCAIKTGLFIYASY